MSSAALSGSTSRSNCAITSDDALGRRRRQRVEARHGVDRFFDLVGDVGLDRRRRRAGIRRDDRDEREVDLRELVDAEALVADDADDDERGNQHAREDRPPDADISEPLHGSLRHFRAVGELGIDRR